MRVRSRVTRRRFVAIVLGAGGLAAGARWRPWNALLAVVPVSDAERLADVIVHRASARRVGRAYLAGVPEEASVPRLVDLISAGLPHGLSTLRDANTSDLRGFLAAEIQRDFELDRVVFVQGWALSPTEARLYALTSLL